MYAIAIISTRDSCLHFLNRSIHFFPKTEIPQKPREQWLIKIYVPFIDEISGLAMIKLLDLITDCTNMIKSKAVVHPGVIVMKYQQTSAEIE